MPPYGSASLDIGGTGRGLEVPWRRDGHGERLGAVGDELAEFRRPVATAPTAASGGPSMPARDALRHPIIAVDRGSAVERHTMILQISH
jgi:hypothetical protein